MPSPTIDLSAAHFEPAEVLPAMQVRAVTWTSAGLVVAGCRPDPAGWAWYDCEEALIFVQPAPGDRFEPAELDGAADSIVAGVAETPFGLLAVGATSTTAGGPIPSATGAAWRSTDGRRWTRLAIPAPTTALTGVAVAGGRAYVWGTPSEAMVLLENRSWSTDDGVTWTPAAVPLTPKVAAGAGLVAVGMDCLDVCPTLPITVRRSADGVAWTLDDPDPALEGLLRIPPLATLDASVVGLSVAGSEERSHLVAILDDRGGWIRTELPGGENLVPGSIAATEGLAVAFGSSTDGIDVPTGWWSSDGLAWQAMDIEGLPQGSVTAAAIGDGIAVAIDGTTVWVSRP